MKNFFSILTSLLTIIFFSQCKKNTDVETIDYVNPKPNIVATVVGRVVDEQNEPVFGAKVIAGTKTTTTNINGDFTLENANLSNAVAYVSVEKANYFTTGRTFITTNGAKPYVLIGLQKKLWVGNINATTGGSITIANGVKIEIPANAIMVEATKLAYNGTVTVKVNFTNETEKNFGIKAPGNFLAVDSNKAAKLINPHQITAVELSGSSGEKLQILTGKKVKLTLPIPANLLSTSKNQIEAWSFNEQTGVWNYENKATKQGINYVIEASHFSHWCPSVPVFFANVSFKLFDQMNRPYTRALITKAPGFAIFNATFSDDNGNVNTLVNADEIGNFYVYPVIQCISNTPLLNFSAGPFVANSNNNLGTKIVPTNYVNYYKLTGNALNCTGVAITNGNVTVISNNEKFLGVINNGSFEVYVPVCSTPINVEYYALDYNTGKQSNTLTTSINTTTVNVGTITACNNPIQEYFNYSLNGVNYIADSVGMYTNTAGNEFSMMAIQTSQQIRTSMTFNSSGFGNSVIKYFSHWPGFLNIKYSSSNTVNITEFPAAVNGYIAGDFSAIVYADTVTQTPAYPVQGRFRVQRK